MKSYQLPTMLTSIVRTKPRTVYYCVGTYGELVREGRCYIYSLRKRRSESGYNRSWFNSTDELYVVNATPRRWWN